MINCLLVVGGGNRELGGRAQVGSHARSLEEFNSPANLGDIKVTGHRIVDTPLPVRYGLWIHGVFDRQVRVYYYRHPSL